MYMVCISEIIRFILLQNHTITILSIEKITVTAFTGNTVPDPRDPTLPPWPPPLVGPGYEGVVRLDLRKLPVRQQTGN